MTAISTQRALQWTATCTLQRTFCDWRIPVNHSLLTTHHAVERIREDLRETGENVGRLLFGTMIATLYTFADLAMLTGLSKSSRARRVQRRHDRKARRDAAAMAERLRSRPLN
jgi:hypothetical protein